MSQIRWDQNHSKPWFTEWADNLFGKIKKYKKKVLSTCECGVQTLNDSKTCTVCQVNNKFLQKYGKAPTTLKKGFKVEDILRMVS